MKRIVLSTFGSFGDLHPYMALALEWKARGHHPVLATSEIYRPKIEAEGIEFQPVRPDLPPPEESEELISKVMASRTGPEYLFKNLLMPALRDGYDDLSAAVQGADLLVTHPVAMAGPMVAQKTGIPWVSTVLAPLSLFSAYDLSIPPVATSLGRLRGMSPKILEPIVAMGKQSVLPWVEPIFRLRAELGLPRGDNPLFEGQHSPTLSLALFSPLLGAPQPDWPRQVRATGFCFYDRKDETGLSPDLGRFLDEGAPPIVFTLGSSAVFDAGGFFRESMAAARQLGRRAVLLIGDEKNRPSGSLPPGIAAFDYAPYSEIFPRAAAIVHQGGVGTTGQAMRAGKPMLVMPYTHDQPDHAARMERLGIGRIIERNRYSAARAAKELGKLLDDPSYARKAAAVGRQVSAGHGTKAAVDAMEEVLSKMPDG